MKKKGDWKKLKQLFFSTLYISAFTFGGGFVIATFMKKKFVDELHWIDEEEMLDLIALAQSSPGAIAVNAAICVGWSVGGVLGMVVAVIGTIIPPLLIISVISFFYAVFITNQIVALMLKGMQAGVAAIILDVVLGLGKGVLNEKNWIYNTIMITAFAATFIFEINVIIIIVATLLLAVLLEALHIQVKGARK